MASRARKVSEFFEERAAGCIYMSYLIDFGRFVQRIELNMIYFRASQFEKTSNCTAVVPWSRNWKAVPALLHENL